MTKSAKSMIKLAWIVMNSSKQDQVSEGLASILLANHFGAPSQVRVEINKQLVAALRISSKSSNLSSQWEVKARQEVVLMLNLEAKHVEKMCM
jgi:hypothetical protein